MKVSVLFQVTQIGRRTRYPYKPGTTDTDYTKDHRVSYTKSTLTALPNQMGIDGEITTECELPYGELVRVEFDLSPVPERKRVDVSPANWVDRGVSAAEAAVDRLPTGADLDAVADEQQAAEATDGKDPF